MLNRPQFVDDLRALVRQGVAFRHLGREPETGLDCVHAPAWGYRKQGLQLPAEMVMAMESYSEQPDGWSMCELMRKWFIEIPVIDNQVPNAIPSDLLVFYVFRNPKHVAILVSKEPMTVVEAWRSHDKATGKLSEQILDSRRRIAACFRIPDVA